MSGEILKLAKECGVDIFFDSKFGSPDYYHANSSIPALEAFYRAAFNAGLEAAADAADKELEGDCSNATRDAVSDAIRALEMKP